MAEVGGVEDLAVLGSEASIPAIKRFKTPLVSVVLYNRYERVFSTGCTEQPVLKVCFGPRQNFAREAHPFSTGCIERPVLMGF